VKARHFHWNQQRLAFVKTLIYTQNFTRPATRRRVFRYLYWAAFAHLFAIALLSILDLDFAPLINLPRATVLSLGSLWWVATLSIGNAFRISHEGRRAPTTVAAERYAK